LATVSKLVSVLQGRDVIKHVANNKHCLSLPYIKQGTKQAVTMLRQ